jgi:hypothetical protein
LTPAVKIEFVTWWSLATLITTYPRDTLSGVARSLGEIYLED